MLLAVLLCMMMVCSCSQMVDIQPDDGFGTLLPLETINLDVIFSAAKPKVVLGKLNVIEHLRIFVYVHTGI